MADSDRPQRIMVPKERVFSRGQGCWNCIHGSSGKEFWTQKRQEDLQTALGIALNHTLGEEHPKVKNIKQMVNTVDHGVASGALLRCTNGRTAKGDPVGDLVVHNYLCDQWTGKEGASMAREGGRLDPLPEELVDKLDNTPGSLEEMLARVPGNKKVE